MSSSDSDEEISAFFKALDKKISKQIFIKEERKYYSIQHTEDCIQFKLAYGVYGCAELDRLNKIEFNLNKICSYKL